MYSRGKKRLEGKCEEVNVMHREWAGAQSASRTIVRLRLSQGEIATGGWDPLERTDHSVSTSGLKIEHLAIFWVWQAGKGK